MSAHRNRKRKTMKYLVEERCEVVVDAGPIVVSAFFSDLGTLKKESDAK